MMQRFERDFVKETWSHVEPDVEVKFCPAAGGVHEILVLRRPLLRRENENAMGQRQVDKLEKQLVKLQVAAQAPQRAPRDCGKAKRRVGRLMGRYTRAAQSLIAERRK